MLYGTPLLGGGQAQFVRVPHADATAFLAPEEIQPRNLLLMADIFPVGLSHTSSIVKADSAL